MRLSNIFVLLIVVSSTHCQSPVKYPPGYDFALFKDSPVRELAKAVEKDDSSMIIRALKLEKPSINYQEPKYGSSLLLLSIMNYRPTAIKLLLEFGADPNLRSKEDNSTPFLTACEYGANANYQYAAQSWQSMFVLLLDHGANVNDSSTRVRTNNGVKYDTVTTTALEYLVEFSSLDVIKLALEKGARLDIYPRNGTRSILVSASHNLPVLKYLLEKKGVPIPDYAVIRQAGTPAERKITLRDLLVEKAATIRPEEHGILNEIEDFLAAHGG